MKKLLALIILIPTSYAAFSQAGSEILLFDMKAKKGKITITNPRNITNHKGYDNQPSFHTDQPFIYYSSFNVDGRSDIRRFNYEKNETADITQTPDREYSPTLTPDKQYLSCIIQRESGAQNLGKYPVDGGEPELIIDNLTVGYHLWADNSHLAMFILGDNGAPHSLHYMRLPTKEDTVLATNIGRSFHRVPNERAITFIQKGETTNKVRKLNTESMVITDITSTMNNGEDIAWIQDGKIITSDGTKLYFFDTKKPAGGWKTIEIAQGADQLKTITRLAVNMKGDKLAVVVAEP